MAHGTGHLRTSEDICEKSYAAGASILFAYNYNRERNEAYFNHIQQYVNQVFWLGSS